MKDHKDDFNNKPSCRLINPAKPEIGKVSKEILQGINNNLRRCLGLKQWRSTHDVLNWFHDLKFKTRLNFLQLDIINFYPSITEELFTKALNFASQTVTISNAAFWIVGRPIKLTRAQAR